nr:hypothetical protein [Tanacetum cinerariifolium]
MDFCCYRRNGAVLVDIIKKHEGNFNGLDMKQKEKELRTRICNERRVLIDVSVPFDFHDSSSSEAFSF